MGRVGSTMRGHGKQKLLMETALGMSSTEKDICFLHQTPFIIFGINLTANIPEFLAARNRAGGSNPLLNLKTFNYILPA